MSFSSIRLKTPVGDLQVSVDLLAGFQPEASLEIFAFEPVLPQGMSVAACFAVVLHLPGGEIDAQVRLIATLLPVVPVEGGAETGQGLEAQSWRGEKHLVLVGTEDAEFLEARLPSQIRLANDSFAYEPHSFSLNFTRTRGAIPVEVHLWWPGTNFLNRRSVRAGTQSTKCMHR
ncbi:hypothetical protein [Paucibacter sp. Y2R2-4]|uniref:hypothetical protein n=1 Tax=Paucibacter sp. Y2R2-4 TaxID=2893553 RepID=UPI0021E47D3A|nr:hypothetical protein [Paucibacter sp. Y2R2-4]MCV2350663.1 hypothetical protein [Paucibacter sp. Y2R2-4]